MAKTIRKNGKGFSFEGQTKSYSMRKDEMKEFLALKKLRKVTRTVDTSCPAWA